MGFFFLYLVCLVTTLRENVRPHVLRLTLVGWEPARLGVVEQPSVPTRLRTPLRLTQTLGVAHSNLRWACNVVVGYVPHFANLV